MGIGWQFAFEQWGMASERNKFCEYPISFYTVPKTLVSHDGSQAQLVRIYDKKTNGFNHDNFYADGKQVLTGADCMYVAIGY